MQSFKFTISIALLLMTTATMYADQVEAKCVRFVYLVSADRPVHKEYIQAIEHAAKDMQKWYAEQMEGRTFRLHSPVVDVVLSDKNAMWFTTHPLENIEEVSWGFHNTLAEVKRLLGVNPRKDGYTWVIYSDGPGNSGRAYQCFAYLPEDDLLGLMGKHPTQKEPKRWVAGMGHELGHALGLPHPKDTKKHYEAIMWAGFYGGPEKCYLTEEDKKILLANPFMVPPKQDDKEESKGKK